MVKANIFLIGFMGTGKSTILHSLAELLAYKKMDIDQVIAQRSGMQIPQIFEQQGEAAFRSMESDILKECQSQGRHVVACGGGAVLNRDNVKRMKENGVIVLLTASPETILERVKHRDTRPLLNGNMNTAYIKVFFFKQKTAYEWAADITIATDNKKPSFIANEIKGLLA
ncbi:shikimate kinase [Lachnospiraceae bacterium ZAX-1]